MTSCFEGLLELYRVTGVEKYKTAVLNFADRVLENDFTVIGSAGCTHELFDHSAVRQANTTNGAIMQETCVTVTLMKFFHQLASLTGDPRFVDAFETSLYNAYLGSLNTEGNIEEFIKDQHPECISESLPFDSYSPLTAGTRGNLIGGFRIMSDGHYYGCCACIGSAGIGLVPRLHLMSTARGVALNLFIRGTAATVTPRGTRLFLTTATDYPRVGNVTVTISLAAPEHFVLLVRNPAWSLGTTLAVNGTSVPVSDGYIVIDRLWCDGDVIELNLDMSTRAILPIPYGSQVLMNKNPEDCSFMVPRFDVEDPIANRHIALKRGPLMLAQDSRLGHRLDDPISVIVNADGTVSAELPTNGDSAPYPHIVELLIPLVGGEKMTVTDYASAGKLWCDEIRIAVWFLTD